jgi:hypothetical protein
MSCAVERFEILVAVKATSTMTTMTMMISPHGATTRNLIVTCAVSVLMLARDVTSHMIKKTCSRLELW